MRDHNVADGTECDGGACSGGVCVEVDLCEGVDCNDNNECTARMTVMPRTAPATTSTTAPRATTTRACAPTAAAWTSDICDDTGNECTVAMCNNTTGVCDTMNVSDGTECNGGSGRLLAGVSDKTLV